MTRQARKQIRKAKVSSDVYEYIPEHTKRSKVALELDRDEAVDAGSDNDQPLRARLVGENGDDEKIDSDDDEEIDSDAAFEESDDEQFAGFFSRKKKPKKKSAVRFAQVDLNEDVDMQDASVDQESGDDDEEGEDGEFIDVLDVLDGRGEPHSESDNEIKQSDGNSTEESAEEDEEDPLVPSEDEGDAPAALDQLESFISKLDTASHKRKLPEAESVPDGPPHKRRMLKESTVTGPENEFNSHSSSSKLNLDDLLLPGLALKKSVASLASSSKTRMLSAPLPQRAQDRLDRVAAYEQTKEEVDKWKAAMARIRDAEHLSFPLQTNPAGRVSNMELAAKFKPTTELESSVDALLKAAKLREEDIAQTEDAMLKANNLTVEEVAERRAELRKMRELMFRAEIKAKRAAKIKSKTYRKIKRKEKERIEEKIHVGGEDETEDAKLKREADRARERATLRHKNTGKWAKQMKGRAGWDEEGRKGIEEMLDRGEKLRRKIAGKDTDDSDDDAAEESDPDATVETIKADALEALNRLDDDLAESPAKSSKIFEMKFMKDAMARQRQEADRQVNGFVKEMGEEADVAQASDEMSDGPVVTRTGGRIVYRPGPSQPSQSRPSSSKPSQEPLEGPGVAGAASPSPPPEEISLSSNTRHDREESNPWLADNNSESLARGRKKNTVVVGKDSNALDKSKNKIRKQAKKLDEEIVKLQADAALEISVDATLSTRSKGTSDHDSNVNSEVEEQETLLQSRRKGNGATAFQQRDLVALAFAGDNVMKEFEEVKRREIAADAPKEVDVTIAGWGSWGGAGTKPRPANARFVKKVAGIDPKSRADFNKSHVIISEKRDKKAAKYLVKDLPYPYTSKSQFDQRMERPLGLEWNTRTGFQRGTLPKVVKKMGTVIDPLQKLF